VVSHSARCDRPRHRKRPHGIPPERRVTSSFFAVDDASPLRHFPLGDALEVFVRPEDAERFIEEVRGDEPELAAYLRIEERELEAGGLNQRRAGTTSNNVPFSL
jgi:hypothetical protein